MRIRLLVASLVDRAAQALNLRTIHKRVEAEDQQRAVLLGSDAEIREQTLRARAFADELSAR